VPAVLGLPPLLPEPSSSDAGLRPARRGASLPSAQASLGRETLRGGIEQKTSASHIKPFTRNPEDRFGSRTAVVAGLMVRLVCPQLRNCRERTGNHAWCNRRRSPAPLQTTAINPNGPSSWPSRFSAIVSNKATSRRLFACAASAATGRRSACPKLASIHGRRQQRTPAHCDDRSLDPFVYIEIVRTLGQAWRG
jgi:hypothetical protein